MDIRVVETMATSGGLSDPSFRVDSSIENVSLDWDNSDETLKVVDYNMNYNLLPWQLYGDLVKKVFLTYNGRSTLKGQLIETVVMESANEPDTNQFPGYHNSNEWHYTPKTFTYPSEILNMTDITDFLDQPYDYREGFTVVKTFLTAGANVSPGDPAYTAFYRAPTYVNFIPANVEGNKIYTDGWYTSYTCLVRKWDSVDPVNNGSSTGDILFYEPNNTFYMNLTGQGGAIDPATNEPDIANWSPDPSFADWQELMRNNIGPVSTNDPIYFIENQHLVTVDLNKAILSALKKNCTDCDQPKFDLSHMKEYVKLIEKRMGAWVQFNSELFHEAACILESSRPLCNLCLYDNNCHNSFYYRK